MTTVDTPPTAGAAPGPTAGAHAGLTRMTKLEIVVGGKDAPLLHDLLTAAGATGYTSLANVSGFGHSGFHHGRLAFNDRDALTLVLAVVPEEIAGTIVTGVRRLLDERPGCVFVSDTWVSRPEYFRSGGRPE